MKNFFKEIYQYHHHYNQLLADHLEANYGQVGEKALHLFSHSINAHQIWNARVLQVQPLDVHQLNSIAANKTIDKANLKDTLMILEQKSLQENVKYQNSKGANFSNSIQEILFHVVNHFSHHRGQIMYDLRLCGIDPIETDYIFYKR